MKIYKKVIISLVPIIIFYIFYFKSTINANNMGTVNLSANKETISIGEEVEITINIDRLTAAFTANIEFDDSKLKYISGPENTNLVDNRIIFVWYDKTGGNGKKGELGKFKFKAKDNGNIKLSVNGEFYSGTTKLIETSFKDIEIHAGDINLMSIEQDGIYEDNPNLNLETLAVENILLYPPFDPYILNYNIEIPHEIENLNILAIPENEKSKVKIIGNGNFKDGDNKIIITVISQNREKRDYNINARRRTIKEEENYIENKEKEQQQLEQIYEAEKLSNSKLEELYINEEREIQNKDTIQEKNNQYIEIIGIAVIIIIIIITVIIKRKKY